MKSRHDSAALRSMEKPPDCRHPRRRASGRGARGGIVVVGDDHGSAAAWDVGEDNKIPTELCDLPFPCRKRFGCQGSRSRVAPVWRSIEKVSA